jgi:hypothetical protein
MFGAIDLCSILLLKKQKTTKIRGLCLGYFNYNKAEHSKKLLSYRLRQGLWIIEFYETNTTGIEF